MWRIQISLWHIWFPSNGCQLSLWIPRQFYGYLPLQFPAIRFVHLIRPRLSLQVCVPAPWLCQSVLIEMCHFDDSSAGMSADRCSIFSRCSVLGFRMCKKMLLHAISLLHRITSNCVWNLSPGSWFIFMLCSSEYQALSLGKCCIMKKNICHDGSDGYGLSVSVIKWQNDTDALVPPSPKTEEAKKWKSSRCCTADSGCSLRVCDANLLLHQPQCTRPLHA